MSSPLKVKFLGQNTPIIWNELAHAKKMSHRFWASISLFSPRILPGDLDFVYFATLYTLWHRGYREKAGSVSIGLPTINALKTDVGKKVLGALRVPHEKEEHAGCQGCLKSLNYVFRICFLRA